jgi:hypothetical protein
MIVDLFLFTPFTVFAFFVGLGLMEGMILKRKKKNEAAAGRRRERRRRRGGRGGEFRLRVNY